MIYKRLCDLVHQGSTTIKKHVTDTTPFAACAPTHHEALDSIFSGINEQLYRSSHGVIATVASHMGGIITFDQPGLYITPGDRLSFTKDLGGERIPEMDVLIVSADKMLDIYGCKSSVEVPDGYFVYRYGWVNNTMRGLGDILPISETFKDTIPRGARIFCNPINSSDLPEHRDIVVDKECPPGWVYVLDLNEFELFISTNTSKLTNNGIHFVSPDQDHYFRVLVNVGIGYDDVKNSYMVKV